MRSRLLFAVLLSLGLGVAGGASAQSLTGTWQGTGHQSPAGDSGPNWSIVMTIGDNGGSIQYPSLHCTGTLTQISADATSAEYRETITSGTDECISGGDIAVRYAGGNLAWAWVGDSDGEKVQATAVLTRS
jgi:hypothetical protein